VRDRVCSTGFLAEQGSAQSGSWARGVGPLSSPLCRPGLPGGRRSREDEPVADLARSMGRGQLGSRQFCRDFIVHLVRRRRRPGGVDGKGVGWCLKGARHADARQGDM
jgi:hypothetical protein